MIIYFSFLHSSFFKSAKRGSLGNKTHAYPHTRSCQVYTSCLLGCISTQELVQSRTPGPLPHIFEALFQMSRPSTWVAWPWAEVGAGAGWHARCHSSLWRPPVCTDGPTSGSSHRVSIGSLPSRPGRLPGEPNSPQEPNCQRALSFSLAHSSKGVIRDTPQLQRHLCALNSHRSPHSSSHCPAKSNSSSGPLHSLLLPPAALSPNSRRDGSHHTGFTLSLCPSAASSETSSLPSKTLTSPLSALISVLSLVFVCSNGLLILCHVLLSRAAMTNHHKLGGLNQQKFILMVKN